MSASLYMVVERFRKKEALPVYERFREKGRLAPEGLNYVASWVDEKLEVCWQIMETEHRALLQEWMANWEDLVEFEVFPVITSREASERVFGE